MQEDIGSIGMNLLQMRSEESRGHIRLFPLYFRAEGTVQIAYTGDFDIDTFEHALIITKKKVQRPSQ